MEPLHWTFIAQLARDTRIDVLAHIYPMVPRPTATAEHVVQGLVDICCNLAHGVVCVAGNSAGGAIALSTVQQLQNVASETAQKLRSIVLITPVLDCVFDHPEAASLDPLLAIEDLRTVAPKWAGNLAMKDPRVSPLYGNTNDLPPTFLLAGTADVLCADARRLSMRFQGKNADEVVEGSVEVDRFTYMEQRDMRTAYMLDSQVEYLPDKCVGQSKARSIQVSKNRSTNPGTQNSPRSNMVGFRDRDWMGMTAD